MNLIMLYIYYRVIKSVRIFDFYRHAANLPVQYLCVSLHVPFTNLHKFAFYLTICTQLTHSIQYWWQTHLSPLTFRVNSVQAGIVHYNHLYRNILLYLFCETNRCSQENDQHLQYKIMWYSSVIISCSFFINLLNM